MSRPIALLLCLLACWLQACSLDDLGEGSCFAEGTLIATPTGERPIESLRVGDAVWSVDEVTGTVVIAHVAATAAHKQRLVRSLLVPSGRKLRVTDNHPIYLAEEGNYVPASLLREDDELLVMAPGQGSGRPIVAPRALGPQARPNGLPETVYDLTIDGPANYIAEGVLVHNKSIRQPPERCTAQGVGDARQCVRNLVCPAPTDVYPLCEEVEVCHCFNGLFDCEAIDLGAGCAAPGDLAFSCRHSGRGRTCDSGEPGVLRICDGGSDATPIDIPFCPSECPTSYPGAIHDSPCDFEEGIECPYGSPPSVCTCRNGFIDCWDALAPD